MKYLICALFGFIAFVRIPASTERRYVVKEVIAHGEAGEPMGYYLLVLKDGRKVYVPMMFTVIEEAE